ncbi:MAG: class I SAM-dependent methyltransferase [Thermodesulfovibrionales bacterium]
MSNLLKQRIIDRITAEGPISFEDFMEMALYYPDLGYYSRESTEIGRHGDFYTSPHLHQIFGVMMSRQIFEMWRIMEKPSFQIVEMGAGEGYLARDMLDYLSKTKSEGLREFFKNLSYTIIEINPSFKKRQQGLLYGFLDKVNWANAIEEVDTLTGCLLSNELLDSFPIRLIEMNDDLYEIYIAIDGDGNLIEIKRPCGEDIKAYLEEFNVKLPSGYRTEINLRIKDWLIKVSEKFSEGFILTIDYGYPACDYYSESRNRGTLLCYHGHRIEEDPFKYIGEQDITAHVNFSSLKKWGEEVGLKTIGYCEQGPFLVSLGVDEIIKELYGEVPDPVGVSKIKGLIMPEGMGESHKVMIQYKGRRDIKELKGFGLRNRLRWL